MTARRRRGYRASAVAAAALGSLLSLTACGNAVTSKQTPRQAVQTAIADLGGRSNVQVSVSLPVSAGTLQRFADEDGAKMTIGEATALTSGSLFLNVATGSKEPLDSPQAVTDSGDGLDAGLTVGGRTLLEARYVGRNLYLRVKPDQLLTDTGQSAASARAEATRFTDLLGSLETYVPGIDKLGAGGWVEVTSQDLQALGSLLQQIRSSSGAGPATLRTGISALGKDLLGALQSDSTVSGPTSSSKGSEYQMTVRVDKVLAAVRPEIETLLGRIPVLGSQISGRFGKLRVPNGQTMVIDAYVSNGTLTEADIDLSQFSARKGGPSIPLRMSFTSPGTPVAPTSGVTQLNLSNLPGLIGHLLTPSSTKASGSVTPAA